MARLQRSSGSSNWGGPRAALAAILAGAAALRLVGIQYGLPYGSLLNPDEQNVVPRAWRMTHGGGLNPHFFDWPTLVTYAVAPFQAWQGAPSYLAGRFVVVAFALVPLVVVGWGRWRRLAVSGGLAAAAFFVASPFVLLDASSTWSALRRIGREHREGWLGFEHDHWSGIAFAGHLWDGLGPVLLISALGLVLALFQRSRRGDLVLGSFVVGYYVSLLPLHSHFPRYVLPLVPALGALAGRVRALASVSLLLLIVPLTWSIRDDARLTRTDTRLVAAHWIEAHVPKGSTIAAESSTAVPPGYHVVSIPLPFPGHDKRVDTGAAKWVLVSGAVADRVRAARDVYPRRMAFYARLPRAVFRTEAHGGIAGPWVAVYRL